MYYLNSNPDKNIYLFTYVEMILRLDVRFCLSMPHFCVVILPIAWLNSTYKYWWILQSWIDSGLLPVSNLCLAFCDAAIAIFGGFSSGPRPRFSPTCNEGFRKAEVINSLSALLRIVRETNASQVRTVSHLGYARLVARIRAGVVKAGSLTAQHVATVLCLTGVIHAPRLATQALTADGTRCYKRMKACYGVTKGMMDVAIRVVGASIGQHPNVAENALCTYKKDVDGPKKYDSYIPHQRFFTPRPILKRWAITSVSAEDPVFSEVIFRQ